jgi:hypothetical protein
VIEAKVRAPATALVVLAIVMLALLALGAVGQIAVIAEGADAAEIVSNLVGLVFSTAVNALILFGGLKMRQLENYPLAVTAAVLAAVPCFTCCVVGLPLGIWALAVLSDPQVRSAFQ